MSASWNVLKPSGEDVFQIEPGMPGFDYGLPTVFVNASSTAGSTLFSNVPSLGAGSEFKVAYVAKEDGSSTFTLTVPANESVVLATLESGKVATVKVLRDVETWYCSLDCFEVVVEDFDASVVEIEKPTVDIPEPVEPAVNTCCSEACDCAPCTSCLCITVTKVDGTTVDLCATSVSVKGKGINVSLSA